jgi:hypothetical protein
LFAKKRSVVYWAPKFLPVVLGTALAHASFFTMATKLTNNSSDVDGNWSWPEKTWFRERLNAVKARESEQRRKPIFAAPKPAVSTAVDDLKKDPAKVG